MYKEKYIALAYYVFNSLSLIWGSYDIIFIKETNIVQYYVW